MAVDLNVLESIGLINNSKTTQAKGKTNNELAQEDFLKLMTTQLQAQDPVKPQDNTEFLSQMAQFGTVSGIDQLNATMTSFGNAFNNTQALQSAGLVGHDVLTASNSSFLPQSGSLEGFIELPSSATNVKLQVTSPNGQLVKTVSLGIMPGGQSQFAWDGLDDKGQRMPAGNYNVQATGVVGGKTESISVLAKTRVQSVNISSGNQVVLNLAGFGAVPFNQVKQVL